MEKAVYISEPVAQVLQLYDGLIDERAWGRSGREQLELLAERLCDGHRRGLPGAAVELQNWLPRALRRSAEELFEQPLPREDALLTVARGHGFVSWNDAAQRGSAMGDPVFEGAVEDLLAGDVSALSGALDRVPELVHQRSHYGHRALLLHYLGANGVENYRQRVPLNAPELAALLIERGADPRATADMYGGGQTTKGLVMTSAHPAEAGVSEAILAVLDAALGMG